MITPETRVHIRRYFYAEHWKIGTIAQALIDPLSVDMLASRFAVFDPIPLAVIVREKMTAAGVVPDGHSAAAYAADH